MISNIQKFKLQHKTRPEVSEADPQRNKSNQKVTEKCQIFPVSEYILKIHKVQQYTKNDQRSREEAFSRPLDLT